MIRCRQAMRFHSIQVQIKGNVISPHEDCDLSLDIADEFHLLSRSLGFEGERDTYAGLWSTGFVYDDHSLLTGDFLARGLHLDLLCNSEYPVPFGSIFLCLGETLRRIAQCEVTELAVVCKPYSVGMPGKGRKSGARLQNSFSFKTTENSLPKVQCSRIDFACYGQQDLVGRSGSVAFPRSRCYLPELALPFSGIWSQWEDGCVRHAQTIQIVAS